MTTFRPATLTTFAVLAALASGACSDRKPAGAASDVTAGTMSSPGVAVPTGASPAPAQAPVEWRAARTYDLTGDGRPERLSVVASGPTYDSLDVHLQIRSPDDSLLYSARWNSGLYFVYDYRAGKPDSTVERIVRGHLDRLLADSAFTPAPPRGRAALVDTPTVAYDLAELRVRAARAIADTVTLGTAEHDEVNRIRIPKAYRDSVIRDVASRARFRYFAGGEVTYIIAWSEKLRRFVKTFSCC